MLDDPLSQGSPAVLAPTHMCLRRRELNFLAGPQNQSRAIAVGSADHGVDHEIRRVDEQMPLTHGSSECKTCPTCGDLTQYLTRLFSNLVNVDLLSRRGVHHFY